MADFLILNNASLNSSYDPDGTIVIPQQDSENVYTAVTESTPTIVKTADKELWVDGDLTYTLTITNTSDGISLHNAVVADPLDSNLTYNSDINVSSSLGTVHDIEAIVDGSNILSVTFNDEIDPDEIVTITFSVSK